MRNVSVTLNGDRVSSPIEPRTSLADYIREKHDLTGTHLGCEHGVCGACTVLLDNVPVRSCITFAAACHGAMVQTVEGLDTDEIASALRHAFKEEHALQCGYCTPGMLIAARDVVLRLETASETDIRIAMSGNLCRCTGYVGIVKAVQAVIADRRARGIGAVRGAGRQSLGPVGGDHRADDIAHPEAQKVERAAILSSDSLSETGNPARIDADWKPQTTMNRSFEVNHPADVVWKFFGRVHDVASCLPGALLDAAPIDDQVRGRIKVKVGPISASFRGSATISRDETGRSGRIVGSGSDQMSNSATKGVVTYVVSEAATPMSTRVDVQIGFTLTGMLAQFSRSGLVEDIARRLIATFVGNLEARLSNSDGDRALQTREFNAGSMVTAVIRDRLRRLFSRRRDD